MVNTRSQQLYLHLTKAAFVLCCMDRSEAPDGPRPAVAEKDGKDAEITFNQGPDAPTHAQSHFASKQVSQLVTPVALTVHAPDFYTCSCRLSQTSPELMYCSEALHR